VNRLLLFILTLIISGVATMIAPLCGSSVIPHIGYAFAFGFFSGGYVTLTSIILVDIVGIDKLSDAFGVLLLFIGVATAIGTPVVGEYMILNFDWFFLHLFKHVLFTGAMRDAFSHFARPFLWPYLIFGGCTVLSGVILFGIPFLLRKKPTEHQMETGVVTSYSGKDLSSPEQQQKL
jgi:MFS family permease